MTWREGLLTGLLFLPACSRVAIPPPVPLPTTTPYCWIGNWDIRPVDDYQVKWQAELKKTGLEVVSAIAEGIGETSECMQSGEAVETGWGAMGILLTATFRLQEANNPDEAARTIQAVLPAVAGTVDPGRLYRLTCKFEDAAGGAQQIQVDFHQAVQGVENGLTGQELLDLITIK